MNDTTLPGRFVRDSLWRAVLPDGVADVRTGVEYPTPLC